MKHDSVLIMAGGTGGHVFPGMALADELQSRGFNIAWMGTSRGIEAKVIPQANIRLHTIHVSGIRGRGILQLLIAPLAILRAIFSAWKIIREIKPAVVVGFGGYASGPGGVAAKLAGRPLLIHEQNAIAGTTNRYLARIANRVATAFPNVLPNGVFVGNPIRKGIESKPNFMADNKDAINILIMGGSRGARAINEIMPETFALLKTDINVLHQTGNEDRAKTQAAYEQKQVTAEIVEFIDDMNKAFSWADLVICRSGASTVTEIAYVGLPAIFIPFPYAIDDHQTENANFLVKAGAAKIIQQRDLSSKHFAELIDNLCADKNTLKTMGKRARSVACLNAKQKLADMCEELING